MTSNITFAGTDTITGAAKVEILDGITIRVDSEDIADLMELLDDIDRYHDADKVAAICEAEGAADFEDLQRIWDDIDRYIYLPNIYTDEDLGWWAIDEFNAFHELPESLIRYIDVDAYGYDIRIGEGGHHTDRGYVASW